MAPITIRPAAAEDEAALVEGNRALALETEGRALDVAVLRRGVRRVLHTAVGATYFVATVGPSGDVVGQLMITTEWSDWRSAPVWWIQSVYVSPPARQAGVFQALYETTCARARAAGAAGVRLYVDTRNQRAQAVYERMGMNGVIDGVFELLFSPEES